MNNSGNVENSLIGLTSEAIVGSDGIELDNFKSLGIALAIGLLIGLERGWSSREQADGMRVAGLRTYGLLSLLGGIWAMLAQQGGAVLMGFAFLGLTLMVLMAYRGSQKKFGNFSITGSIASLTTFSLGALTLYGHSVLAAATAVIITSLLGFKPILHEWINHIEQQELYATLKLLLISVVILPVLPNQDYGPWQSFNPYHIWLMVVLIASISYMGYFAMRIVGNRLGPLFTGLFGGLVSSTLVTLDLSPLVQQVPAMRNAVAAGILVSWATMFLRVLLLAFIINPALSQMLLPSSLACFAVSIIAAFVFWRFADEQPQGGEIKLHNPFQLGVALKFAAFLVLVMLLSRWLKDQFGDLGTYALAAISGLADVDAITLSMAHLTKTKLELGTAAKAILLAMLVNSGFKAILSWLVGELGLGLRIGGVTLFMFLSALLLM